ncbi:Cation/H+ exchanger [Candidatus Magnetoovum chiemensis]|nr:Cation/H+ exchanger [Candidatus Magnetoovum chiemensis]
MEHNDLVILLLSLSALLAVGVIFGELGKKIGIPKVIGELIGGIIIGPTLVGKVYPYFYQTIFPSSGIIFNYREAIVKIGIIFLLFVVGLELNFKHIKDFRKTILFTSFLGFLIPFILGFSSILLFPNVWDYSYNENKYALPFFIGIALSISALPVIARILLDLNLTNSKIGSIIIASATLTDVIGWLFFAQLILYFETSSSSSTVSPLYSALTIIILFIAALNIGKKAANKFVQCVEEKEHLHNAALSLTIIAILVNGALLETLGIHAMFGAFLIGMAFSENKDKNIYKNINKFIMVFFSPLYFTCIGLQANFFKNFDLKLTALVLIIAVLGKLFGAGLGSALSGIKTKEALAIGFGMNARGAMEIVLAAAAYQAHFISERIFVSLIVMAIVTTVISGPTMKRMLA